MRGLLSRHGSLTPNTCGPSWSLERFRMCPGTKIPLVEGLEVESIHMRAFDDFNRRHERIKGVKVNIREKSLKYFHLLSGKDLT